MPADLFKVIARFENAEGRPFTGSAYKVTLLDQDRLLDDKLGSTTLSEDGTAEFLFSAADILSIDSIGERKPDLYFVISENGNEVFRSEVFPEVDFDATDPVTNRKDNVTREFGPFRVTGQKYRWIEI
ncbi:MAG: hypothetical protein GWP67_07420 [Gammaproteobacteria bacterium]|jgi:hypothetical protein|nr:hypothetical protein [Gammaproteobacteria bacterium]